jgi:prepilin-type N-terminal cleavage/methylation domain-containing protein
MRGNRGFTLTELAVVLTIVAFLLASLMYTLSAQTEQRNLEDTRRRIEQARELILSFAIVNGRLPCPARYASDVSNSGGLESFCTAAAGSSTSTCSGSETTTVQTHGTCSNHFDGYVPAATLGYSQSIDPAGFALDAWGNRIRYVVTRTNTGCSGVSTPPNSWTTMYTSKTYLQNYGITCQPSDLLVCKSSNGITGTDCGGTANQIMNLNMVVAIVFSTGKNYATAQTSAAATAAGRFDEAANLDGDRVFVFHTPTPSDFAWGEFDDQFAWITVGELYGRMVAAGVLP